MRRSAIFGLTAAALISAAGVALADDYSISLRAPKFSEAIKVDGVLDDAGWVDAAARGGKTLIDINHTADAITGYPRAAYVGYDDKALSFAFIIMTDKELTATETDAVWGEDECEIFLSADELGYGHIGVNAVGSISREIMGECDWSLDDVTAAAKKSGIATYIEVSVPFAGLGIPAPKSGTQWKINLNGHQTDGDMWLAANATYGGFHNVDRFFTLTFE